MNDNNARIKDAFMYMYVMYRNDIHVHVHACTLTCVMY